MRNKRGLVLITLGLLLIAAALGLAAYNTWDSSRAEQASGAAASELEAVIHAAVTEPEETEPAAAESMPPELEVEDYPQREMAAVELEDGYRYVGIVEIPSLDLELPVMEEWDYTRLKKAPCRYTGSVYLDNMVIAAHNYRSHFGPVKWLTPGTEVRFTDVEGNVYRYQVIGQETLQPNQVEEMTTGDWDLTLFTCNLGGSTRCVIRCERIEN